MRFYLAETEIRLPTKNINNIKEEIQRYDLSYLSHVVYFGTEEPTVGMGKNGLRGTKQEIIFIVWFLFNMLKRENFLRYDEKYSYIKILLRKTCSFDYVSSFN